METSDADSTPAALHTFERRMTWLMYAVTVGIVIAVVLVLNFRN
ncbi:hypothetical protein SAMN05414139_01496 [Burkholderia sp. D7]|nr:hypothetical protein SAMN05414139_01496 [Burkholderia sp. D7]